MKNFYDVIVVGTGNAALTAALSASDNGAKKILVIEKASKKEHCYQKKMENCAD